SASIEFLTQLHMRFEERRQSLLRDRAIKADYLRRGDRLDFLAETEEIRARQWQVAPAPADLNDRRVEITGPTEVKMMINALNSGAHVFMADLEDATSPTWHNIVSGQANLQAAVRGELEHVSADGKIYKLKDKRATLVLRPRGWHLNEKNVTVNG